MQAVAFKDDFSRQTIEEDNDLYCPSGEGWYTKNDALPQKNSFQ